VPDEISSKWRRTGGLTGVLVLLLFQAPIPALCAEGPDASVNALQQAQRRYAAADEELKRAKRHARDAGQRVKDAEQAQEQAARKLEEAKARVERTRGERTAADAAVADAQRQYDQARSVIEEIYGARQGAAR